MSADRQSEIQTPHQHILDHWTTQGSIPTTGLPLLKAGKLFTYLEGRIPTTGLPLLKAGKLLTYLEGRIPTTGVTLQKADNLFR